jgi:hypothetical protein
VRAISCKLGALPRPASASKDRFNEGKYFDGSHKCTSVGHTSK